MGISTIVAYSIGFGLMLIFLLIAVIMSNGVPYVPGGADVGKRRGIFWVWCVLTPIISMGVNAIIWSQINVPALQQNYIVASCIASGLSLVLFIVIGAVIGFATRGKLQRWPF